MVDSGEGGKKSLAGQGLKNCALIHLIRLAMLALETNNLLK